MEPTPEEIAKLAYQFYVEDGKPEGFAADHWKRAEEFLRHPEDHSEQNVLSIPSEPEITPALDEKARELDTNLPSDPRSGKNAVHQRVDMILEKKERKNIKRIQTALKPLPGIEKVDADANSGRVSIHFDARRTNPAAIHEAISGERDGAGPALED